MLCSFERDFLAVPQEALIETMEINQKFFPVLDDGGTLTEQFIGIANIQSKDVAEVAKGYERVIRPRFADAKFFFDEDLKQGLEAMGAGLASVTYQAKLGTVADKVARVAALAEIIAPQVGADPLQARRAAALAKNDLQSRMVNEFPELQGIAGRHYAKAAGEPSEIALAIDEAYQPRFAGDDIALSPLGNVLAIAERLDTLAGGFAAGLKPTGNKDPFALRRNALGLARTVIESGFDLSLIDLLKKAVSLVNSALASSQAGKQQTAAEAAKAQGVNVAERQSGGLWVPNVEATSEEIFDFILDRLRGYYADKGVPATHFNAVAALFSVTSEAVPTPTSVGAHPGATPAPSTTSTAASMPSASSPRCPKPMRWLRRTSASAISCARSKGRSPAISTPACCASRPRKRWPKRWKRPSATPAMRSTAMTMSPCSHAWRACAHRWMRSSTA